MRKRIYIVLCMAVFACGMTFSGGGAFFDVQGSDLYPIVESLSYTGILDGFPDGSYQPQGRLTRGQFCKIMVKAMPAKDTSYRYSNYTIFPDVPHTHWAAPYINFAVSSQKMITGYPNGTFGPDENITEAQAITIAIRSLGYTVEDVGPFWPRDYIEKAGEIGMLDDLTVEENAPITREKAARLIYNLLTCNTKESGGFILANISSIISSGGEGIVVATADTDTSLSENELRVGSGSICISEEKPFPSVFVGVGGTIIYDRNQKAATANKIIGFVPDGTKQDVVVVFEAKAAELVTADKKTVKIPSATNVVINNQLKTYGTAWVDIGAQTNVTIRYNKSGAISMISCGTGDLGGIYVLEARYDGSYNPLGKYFPSGSMDSKIVKNGVAVTMNDLRKYDVVTYNPSSDTFYICDYRIAGIFQDAEPSAMSPDTVKVLGQTFRVLPGAKRDFEKLKAGGGVTLLLTSNQEVAGAVSSDTLPVRQYAVFEKNAAGSYLNMVLNNIKIPFTPTFSQDNLLGQLVSVSQSPSGEIQVGVVSNQDPGGDYYVGDYKLGDRTVSKGVKVFEKVSGSAPAVRVEITDITIPRIPSGKIITVLDNNMGQVAVILLNDVLGDSYIYGKMTLSDGTLIVTNKDITVSGSDPMEIATSSDTFGGAVFSADGIVVAIKPVKRIATVFRDQFYYDESVKIGDRYVKLSRNVQVYLETTKEFVTLEKAKTFCSQFEIYSENELLSDQKVRLIIGKP